MEVAKVQSYDNGIQRQVDRSEATLPDVVLIVSESLDRPTSPMPKLEQREVVAVDLHASQVATGELDARRPHGELYDVDLNKPNPRETLMGSQVGTEVVYPAYKVNRTVFRALLCFFVFPAFIYKGIIHLLNALHPFEKLDRSFTELKSLHFKVGSSSDPQSSREGRSIIEHEIRKGTRKTVPGEDKDYPVLRETQQKFCTGFSDLALMGTDGKLIENDPVFSTAILQAEGISLKVAATAHRFLNDETKRVLLQSDNNAINDFDYYLDDNFSSGLPDGKEWKDLEVEDYVNAYLAMSETDKKDTQVHLFRGHVMDLFSRFPEDSRTRHYEIMELLKVRDQQAALSRPHEKAANQRSMEIIAEWAGMSVEEAFGNLDVSNPVSIFQALMIHHVMSPENKDESKLINEIFQAGGSYNGKMKENRVVGLLPQENGFARMFIKWECEVSIGGQTRRYEIQELIGIKAGSELGRPATVEIHRIGKKMS